MSEKKTNVAWISGAYYLAKPILDKVKEKVKGTECFLCNSDTEFSQLITALTSNHCFCSNRFVLVFGIPKMTDAEKKKFKTIIENLTEDILLVFFMIDPSEEKAIFNSVEKIGKIYNFDLQIASSEAKGWVDKRTSELGINIDDKAKLAMIENCGYDSDRRINIDIMNSALIKLILCYPGKKLYDISDIISTSSFYDSFIVWDLLNACDERDYEKCINLFHKCVLTSKNSIEALNKIIHTLTWKYRLLLFIKEKIANKVDKQVILNEASSIRKISYNGTGFNSTTRIDVVQTGDNKGNPSCIWNSGIVSRAMNSQYGRKATIDLYSRKEIYLIMKCMQDCLILTRSCVSEAEAYLIADIIFMTIGLNSDDKTPKLLQESLMSMRV